MLGLKPKVLNMTLNLPTTSPRMYFSVWRYLLQAWSWQQNLVTELLNDAHSSNLGSVLLLQHPPVLTLGAGSTEDNLLFDTNHPPFPLFRTERGGEATYHGPGQLVMYPILDLQKLKPDLHWYLRCLEEVVIR